MDFRVIYLGFNNILKFKRGVENVILNQVASLNSKGNIYICFDTYTKVYRYQDLICISIKNNIFRFIVLNIILFKLKGRAKTRTLIHSHNYLMSFFLLLKTNVFTIHDGLFYSFNQVNKSKLSLIGAFFIEKLVYKRTQHLHFISNYTKSQSLFRSKPNNTPYSIIYNTFIPGKHLPLPQDTNRVPKDTIDILLVRSMEERANIQFVIDFAEYLNTFPGQKFQFIVIGKGPLLNFYREKITDMGLANIKFLGYLPDQELVHQYILSDVVLLTANYGEGFGLPIIEGYYYDKPVIASNVCAIPEIIFGPEYLFDHNINSAYAALKFALANNVKGQFRCYFDNMFSPQIILRSYFNLYMNVLNSF